ncbi:hypothetical protein IQ07DRAFT_201792 [Pyrenochaeta sp. DS3sAY3a]|nr:hypothetical protein IQ07DRAFT_201792 [Pyrenochaeta sp. DS3sAY3a]
MSSNGDSSDSSEYVVDWDGIYWLRQLHTCAIVFIVLSVLFVSLRFIGMRVAASKRKAIRMGIDDALIIAALVSFLPLCILQIIRADRYIASNLSLTPTDEQLMDDARIIYGTTYGFSIIYPIAVALPKISICFMYRRIFNVHVNTRRIVDCLIVFLIANCIGWFVPSVLICSPPSSYWNPPTDGTIPKCLDIKMIGTWIPFPHIVSDLVILILPLPILIKMQLKLSKKIGLTITFIAGSIGLIGACIRFGVYVHRNYVTNASALMTSTASEAVTTIVSIVEPGMYLIAACLPSMRVLIRELHTPLSSFLSSFRERRQGSASKESGRTYSSDGFSN